MKKTIKKISGYFDALEFWNSCELGKPVVKDTEVIIPASHIEIFEEHPLNQTGRPIIWGESKLVFGGVRRSDRVVFEYLGDPKSGGGFKRSYQISDGPFALVDEPVMTFVFEGILLEPLSYVTWEIDSVSFHLEVEESIA